MRRPRISSLYRSVIPWNPATAWAWFASIFVLVTTWMAHGLHSGVRGGIAVFLAWAIVREIAPRRAIAAGLAPVAAVLFAIPTHTDLLACWCVLMSARIAARTVGDPPTKFDCVLLIPFAAWVAERPAGLPAALVLAAMIYVDSPPRYLRVAGVLALAAILVVGSVEGTLTLRPHWGGLDNLELVLLAATALAALATLAWPLPTRLRERDDRRRGQLSGVRIRIARIGVLASVLAAVAWLGSVGPFALSSASAALLAAGIGGAGARAARDSTRSDRSGSGTLSS